MCSEILKGHKEEKIGSEGAGIRIAHQFLNQGERILGDKLIRD